MRGVLRTHKYQSYILPSLQDAVQLDLIQHNYNSSHPLSIIMPPSSSVSVGEPRAASKWWCLRPGNLCRNTMYSNLGCGFPGQQSEADAFPNRLLPGIEPSSSTNQRRRLSADQRSLTHTANGSSLRGRAPRRARSSSEIRSNSSPVHSHPVTQTVDYQVVMAPGK